ncbi:MAG: sugar transferase [Hyphomicrobium sp.]
MKRAVDLSIGLLGLLVFALIAPVIALLIKLESRGPVIFAQTRVGRNERVFRCYKFRTMETGTAEVPTHQMTKADVTRVGRFLRATKLDELPQLYNVVRGEMSLVGPRPCLPSQTPLIEARRMRGVMHHLPGITGLAQVRGVDMSDHERLAKIDADYAGRTSIGLDFRILCATIVGNRLIGV